jgi:hypothetical protein
MDGEKDRDKNVKTNSKEVGHIDSTFEHKQKRAASLVISVTGP